MGWQLDDDTGSGRIEHEGWVAYVAPDGRLGSSSSRDWVEVRRPDADQRARAMWEQGESPSYADMYDRIPWDDVCGFQVACTCGWTGRSWNRSEFTDRTPEYAPMIDAEDSELADGQTVDEVGYAAWLEHVTPLAAQTAIRQAAGTAATAKRALDEAVAAARAAEPPLSWAEIGRAAGMSRQAAHVRWGSNQADG